MIDASRLAAPEEQLGLLIEPPAARWRNLLSAPADLTRIPIHDTTAAALRDSLRQRLKLVGPVIATGHQAEFFHAGVFAKTIAAEHVARALGGTALFLTVDSDVAKHEQLVVPQVIGPAVRRIEIRVPGVRADTPVEHLPSVPRDHWLDFFARIAGLLPDYEHAALRTYANGWLSDAADSASFATRLEHANAAVERSLGASDVATVRMSALSGTPEFQTFAWHLIRNARTFAEHYNAAQREYRRRRRIRTNQRPVPPLRMDGPRVELPFWVSRPGGGRRRLFVTASAGDIALFADDEALAKSDLATALRPRALLLSCFARLFLADVFIHGIGGARYDEMTEAFTRSFFGIELPPMTCVSATVRLSLPRSGISATQLAIAARQARDVRYNPQRYVSGVPVELLAQREARIAESSDLRSSRPSDRIARRTAFHAIRDANERILAVDAWRAAALDEETRRLQDHHRTDRIALDREYFFALHPQTALSELATRIRAAFDRP